MTIEQIDSLKDGINDYVFDHWDTLDQDPEHLEYELDDFHFDENGNPSCFIKFPGDPVLYTAVDFSGNIQLFS